MEREAPEEAELIRARRRECDRRNRQTEMPELQDNGTTGTKEITTHYNSEEQFTMLIPNKTFKVVVVLK